MEFVGYEDDVCSLCSQSQKSTSNLLAKTFRVNTLPQCGHKFCDDCLKREFARKRSFLCPKCGLSVTQEKVK